MNPNGRHGIFLKRYWSDNNKELSDIPTIADFEDGTKNLKFGYRFAPKKGKIIWKKSNTSYKRGPSVGCHFPELLNLNRLQVLAGLLTGTGSFPPLSWVLVLSWTAVCYRLEEISSTSYNLSHGVTERAKKKKVSVKEVWIRQSPHS